MSARALFITHAGPRIGGGHLSRCLALAQALAARGVECAWLLNEEGRPQAAALGVERAFFERDPFDAAILPPFSDCQFAVVDSYEPPVSFYAALAEKTRVVAIDDLHDRGVERFARVVVNYGIGARRECYADAECDFLLGPRYAPLRREYWEREPKTGAYALFAPGAADVLNASERVMALWRPEWRPLVVVLGALVPEGRRIAARERARRTSNIKLAIAPPNFAALLANAGMAICSASVTAYEALAMQKRLAVFSVAPNQAGLGEALSEIGAAYDLGAWEGVTPEGLARAISFSPDWDALRGLVRKDGALLCAEELLRLLGELP